MVAGAKATVLVEVLIFKVFLESCASVDLFRVKKFEIFHKIRNIGPWIYLKANNFALGLKVK